MLPQDTAGDRGSTHGTAGPSLHLCVCVVSPSPPFLTHRELGPAKNTLREEEEVAGGSGHKDVAPAWMQGQGAGPAMGQPPPHPLLFSLSDKRDFLTPTVLFPGRAGGRRRKATPGWPGDTDRG